MEVVQGSILAVDTQKFWSLEILIFGKFRFLEFSLSGKSLETSRKKLRTWNLLSLSWFQLQEQTIMVALQL
jgi:hypothetical protein